MRILTAAKPMSSMAMAIALATGAVAISGLAFADPAYAQRKKDKKPKTEYSKEFIAVYTPLNDAFNAENPDYAALRPQLATLAPTLNSSDEKHAGGGLIYNFGAQTQDQALQLQGMELMIESGKLGFDQVGRFNFIAYQLSNALGDYPKARNYLQMAINLNFTTASVSAADLQIAMAENYFSQDQYREGLAFLSQAIESRRMARQDIEESWYRRGLTIAYNQNIVPDVYDFVVGWVGDYGDTANWRDAINLARNLNEYEGAEMLDLMRLGSRVGSLINKQDYILYIEAADARRLPQEVKNLIEEGYANGIVSRDDIFVSDSLETANMRIDIDRAELPTLEADADAPNATVRTVIAAADTFLSYGDYAKAERFYVKGLAMEGVERAKALTRLGIAQAEQGKAAEAQATLGQVDGPRLPIAMLWATYAAEQAASADLAVAGS